MFSRIRLTKDDARFHRFLWYNDKGEQVVYQMDRLTFGDCCSPFIALKTIRKVAEDHGEGKKAAVRAIHKNFYVDDYLDSAETENEMIKRAKDVATILSAGDFHLTKWISNSKAVMDAMEGTKTTTIRHEIVLGPNGVSVLGIQWHPANDTLNFNQQQTNEVKFTRRGLVNLVASIYDPLGFLAPFTVKAKIKLREIVNLGGGWNDAIPESLQHWWQRWVTHLPLALQLSIPRCFFSKGKRNNTYRTTRICRRIRRSICRSGLLASCIPRLDLRGSPGDSQNQIMPQEDHISGESRIECCFIRSKTVSLCATRANPTRTLMLSLDRQLLRP